MVMLYLSQTAEMALRLNTVNRWCITGTPLQRGIEDLYGLVLFLGIDPFFVQLWWNRALLQPFLTGERKPLKNLLNDCMWRTAKSEVLDQIRIPEQTEIIHWLTSSPIEEHFYRTTQELCVKQDGHNLLKFPSEIKLSQLDKSSLNKILNPLLRLRQACCHPKAVRGELTKKKYFIILPFYENFSVQFYFLSNSSIMTMSELLESMIHRTVRECEEAHRQFVASLNGLAAIALIEEDVIILNIYLQTDISNWNYD